MKKFISVLLTLSLLFVVGCSSGKDSSEAYIDLSGGQNLQSEETDPKLSSKENEAVEPEFINLLTGNALSEAAVGKRPVAVMVNNLSHCFPQYGIEEADIIFEIPVEYDITRFMAIYADYSNMPDICSVRSARYYYPIFALGYDAVYTHWGLDSITAGPVMVSLGVDDIDGDYGLFGRDQGRINSGYAIEHTGVFYGSQFKSIIDQTGYRTDLDEKYNKTAFSFAKMGESAAPSGENAKKLKISFGNTTVTTFDYNEETEKYYKFHNANAHIDGNSGAQLSFENIFVLETYITSFDDGRKKVDWGSGSNNEGYYISKGKAQKIYWSKENEYAPLIFTDETGEELIVNRGKSYIAVNYYNSFIFE